MPEEERDSIKADLHIHSEASKDGKEPVELILEHASNIGLDVVAITDHDKIEKSLEAVEKAEDYELIAIPGVEVSTADGHLLALGVEECPKKGMPFDKTVKKIRDLGGIAVVPHPFQRMRHGVKKSKIKDCDAIETYNSWLLTGLWNRRAKKFARNRGYPEIASSDAHKLGTVGRAYTEINTAFAEEEEFTQEEILEAIKNGSNYIYGKRKPIPLSMWDYGKSITKKIMWFSKETIFLPAKIDEKIFEISEKN